MVGKKHLALRIALLTLCLCASVACSVHAQIPTYTSPQAVQQTLATNLPCTGSAQTFPVQNLGQTQHYAYISSSATATMNMEIDGVDAAGDSYRISDTSRIGQSLFGTNPVLSATGYFPVVKIVVTCTPTSSTFTLSYTGTSSTTNQNAGGYQLAQVDKVISGGSSAGTNLAGLTFQTPFGSSFGSIYFTYAGGAGPAGSVISAICAGEASTGTITDYVFYPATAVGQQLFVVPDSACPNITVTYVSGGASSELFAMDYIFPQPPFKLTNSYSHVTGTTATVIKAGTGVVHDVVVGTPAAGTITFSDLAPASCTGTPATNTVSVITATSTAPLGSVAYDTLFLNGICVKASATMDFTVNYQ